MLPNSVTPRRARNDFVQSQELAARLGQHVLAAGALHNLAYLDGRLGRFPAALRGFAEAREHYAMVGSPGRYIGDLDIDECEVLIETGLAVEAEQMAARVVEAARASGNAGQLGEALVSLARSRLMLGDAVGTETTALEAADLFTSAGRAAWAALARYLAIVAVDRQPDRRTTAVRQFVRLQAVADRLERHGWVSEAAEIRVLTGRHAIDAGRRDIAGEVLRGAAGARRHPLARVRSGAWYAAALLAHAEGDSAGAARIGGRAALGRRVSGDTRRDRCAAVPESWARRLPVRAPAGHAACSPARCPALGRAVVGGRVGNVDIGFGHRAARARCAARSAPRSGPGPRS